MDEAAPGEPATRAGPPAYDASLADHGLEAKEFRGLTYPLGDHAPGYGEYFAIQPGLGWTRLPVPGSLDHINIWLLDDRDDEGEGVAIVDTGLYMPASTDAWKVLFADGLQGRRITRVLVTHFHPDHVGAAGWLCRRFGVRLWMNRTEWLMARMLTADVRAEPPQEALDQMRLAGWDEARLEQMRAKGWGNFARMVSEVPVSHVRMDDSAQVEIGERSWTVMTGGGHTPEHACLVDRAGQIVIAGDQILPRITSNVSMMTGEPTADPLREWLDSIAKFRAALTGDELILPAHGFPFTGVHARLDALASGHIERLEVLEAALKQQPMRAVDTFGILFARHVDDSVYGIATGEALAHLRYLECAGRATCTVRDGVGWYSA
ncbi:MBL fold metallo-hydrolase [Blastomonas sp. AAP53]|uniref:MBL fold metallo-hydrolase n=1 Tax=Blastomonas sp. AAP53 TaxID=1248760 RepID=UPI0002D6CDD5|nr:MBL fold metallo-hydrolase [Blastomonas sp. AAP53]